MTSNACRQPKWRSLNQWTRQSFMGLALCLAVLNPVRADSLNQLGALSPDDFLTLSENIAAVTHYKSIAPAEPLGLLGFDVALEITSTDINSVIFDQASSGGFALDTMLAPRLHAHLGLPFGLDVGVSLVKIPDTDFQVTGAELRYSILRGSTTTPAIAVRVSYAAISGVDDLDMEHAGVEAAISKGILMFTPYGGVGLIRTNSSPDIAGLSDVSFNQEKVFVGVNINWGLNFGFEVDKTGEYTSYSAKIGLRW